MLTIGYRAHRLDRVRDQIQENLLQLTSIGQNSWEPRSQRRRDEDALSTQIEVEDREHFANEIERLYAGEPG